MIWFLFALVALFALWVAIRLLYVPKLVPVSLYYGRPGCGKTMFSTRRAIKHAKKNNYSFTNYQVLYPGVYKFSKSDLGRFEFPDGSLLVFDEGSLNGFDNRNFKTNFVNGDVLSFFKEIRKHHNAIIFTNQGWEELDLKIRILTSKTYIVRKLPFFSVAIEIHIHSGINKDSKEPKDEYKYPNIFRILFDPSAVQLVFRPLYGTYFNSFECKKFTPIKLVPWLEVKKNE